MSYIYDRVTIFFKHTDFYGATHPYYFFEWMSYARESFFKEKVENFFDLINRNLKMVTAKTEIRFFGQSNFGDDILVKINSSFVKRISFDVIYEFVNKKTEAVIAVGSQKLTFVNEISGAPEKIPDELKVVVLQYEVNNAGV